MPASTRTLFKSALIIFIITVVIGILNGTDIWDPPRNTLLTHVHAGTLGWITLSVFGAAIWMLGGGGVDPKRMAYFGIFAIAAYVLAFWSVDLTTPTTVQRPIGGTLAFIAMTWVLVWAIRARARRGYDVAQFGILLSLVFLVFGAILGVLLGLQLADVEIVSAENADRLAASHPGAMVIGFVVLAGVALVEWLIRDEVPRLRASKSGTIQMLLLFIAGVVLVVAFLLDNEDLLTLGVPLQVVATVILLVRHWARLAPPEWGQSVAAKHVRTAVLGLVVVVGFIGYLISQIVAGVEFNDLLNVAVAMDHVNFLLVMTSLIFAMMAKGSSIDERRATVVYWGLTVGVIGFVIGIVLEEAVLKRIFTPILGLALLYGIYIYGTARDTRSPAML